MLESKKISFLSAVLININIVIGSAFFLGAPDISEKSGFFSPLLWIGCAILLLPLVLIFSKFAYKYPEAGGIYVYSESELGRFWGYLGAWLYFIGTTACNAMVLHCFARYLYEIPAVTIFLMKMSISLLFLELILLILFTWISLFNIQIFERAQFIFSGLKMIPFMALIIGAAVLFSPTKLLTASTFSAKSMFSAFPTVLFAYIGIEACSAIIDKVEDGARRGFKVILTSFAFIAAIYAIGQMFIVGIQGQSTQNPFLCVLPQLSSQSGITIFGNQIIYMAILFSFLGGFYSMFYVNSWNLFAIAQKKSIAFSRLWQSLNKQQAPWASVLLQGTLIAIMLMAGNVNNLLIVMGDLGVLLAYALTAIAFTWARPSKLGVLGIVSAIILGGFLLQEVSSMGLMTTIPFWSTFVIGLIMYRRKNTI
jgi:APA family basic amino acid/polyamine antiporter